MVPYSSKENGVVERKNRILCESARSIIFDAILPKKYWGEAVMTACYIQNQLPTKAVEKNTLQNVEWVKTRCETHQSY